MSNRKESESTEVSFSNFFNAVTSDSGTPASETALEEDQAINEAGQLIQLGLEPTPPKFRLILPGKKIEKETVRFVLKKKPRNQ